jgi:hypothetical protein
MPGCSALADNKPLQRTGRASRSLVFERGRSPARPLNVGPLSARATMQKPVVQAEFDGVTRDGREIVIRVAIGDRKDLPATGGALDVEYYIEIEPLMDRKLQGGTDSLMAMCFCIHAVRRMLKIFVAHGGTIYCRGTRSPIDLESYWFEPIDGWLRPEFLQPKPAPPRDQA